MSPHCRDFVDRQATLAAKRWRRLHWIPLGHHLLVRFIALQLGDFAS
jgi:hypothetical protein